MKHASDSALDQLDDLLEAIRRIPGLVEKKRGIFYRTSKAFLHFHEDPAGLFADLRPGAEWLRLPVNTPEEREAAARIAAGERGVGGGWKRTHGR
jgi:hypothetical protein